MAKLNIMNYIKANYFASLFILVSWVLLFSSCQKECEDTIFEMNSIGLTPRTVNSGTGENTAWSNEDSLPSVRLGLRLDMQKTLLNNPSLESGCFPKYKINNKAKSIKMFSNQPFNSGYQPGSDLLSISVFTSDIENFITREDFLESFFNGSNFSSYFILFNLRPEIEATHLLRIVVDYEDGTSMETDFIEVFLKP